MSISFKSLNGIALILFLSLFFGSPVISQVTIGTHETPLKGALLDLKQNDDATGGTTAKKGMMYPRVALNSLTNLSPLDDAPVSLKQYTGMTVYNVTVNAGADLQEGLYVWDGAKWNPVWEGIIAANGLTFTGDSIILGGILNQPTTIDLNSNDLLFTRGTGNVGIGTTSPLAILHLKDEAKDPLIIDSLKYTSDPQRSITDTAYYNLQISNGGVVRKSPLVNDMSKTFIFTLYNTSANSNITITTGGADGLGGSLLTWRIGGKDSSYVALPEDGAFMFSFRLYGTVPTANTNRTNSFYFSSLVNSTNSNVYDVQEIVLTSPVTNNYQPMTYTANLTVAGKKGDKIYFRLAELNSGHVLTWTLNGSTSEKMANRTSMVYWKL